VSASIVFSFSTCILHTFFHNIIDDIDLRNLKSVSDFNAGDISFVNQVVCQVSAYAEHLLKLSYRNNIRIVREHHFVKLFQFCFSHLLNLLCEKKAARYVQLCKRQQSKGGLLLLPFAVLPECRFCYPCPYLSGVASLSSSPTVIAKSYSIRTVIQF